MLFNPEPTATAQAVRPTAVAVGSGLNETACRIPADRGTGPGGRVPRCGVTLTETLVAVVLLAAALVAVAQTVATVARQRELTVRQTVALAEAANALERLQRLPYDALSQDTADQLRLSPIGQQRLPDGRLQVTVQTSGEEPAGKRLQAAVDWQEMHGGRSAATRLTAWRFALPEPQR
jgi:hypothetical protein